MSQTVVLKVGMSCQGCVGAVNRVLGKMEGVESFDIDLKDKKVTVKGNIDPEAVLQTVSKTGKPTSFWPVEETEPKPEEIRPKETEQPKPSEGETDATSVSSETKPTEPAVAAA